MDSSRFNEILNFILKKCIVAVVIVFVTTAGAFYVCFSMQNNIFNIYKDAFDIKAQNEITEQEISKLKIKLKEQQNEKKEEKVKEDKIPIVVYKPLQANAPIESSAIDLVTGVIQSLERTHNSIIDISYSIVDSQQGTIPSNISIVKLNMTLNGSYVSFQDFLFDLYDDEYVSTIKQTKMVPLQENKSQLEITTEIWLYISKS